MTNNTPDEPIKTDIIPVSTPEKEGLNSPLEQKIDAIQNAIRTGDLSFIRQAKRDLKYNFSDDELLNALKNAIITGKKEDNSYLIMEDFDDFYAASLNHYLFKDSGIQNIFEKMNDRLKKRQRITAKHEANIKLFSALQSKYISIFEGEETLERDIGAFLILKLGESYANASRKNKANNENDEDNKKNNKKRFIFDLSRIQNHFKNDMIRYIENYKKVMTEQEIEFNSRSVKELIQLYAHQQIQIATARRNHNNAKIDNYENLKSAINQDLADLILGCNSLDEVREMEKKYAKVLEPILKKQLKLKPGDETFDFEIDPLDCEYENGSDSKTKDEQSDEHVSKTYDNCGKEIMKRLLKKSLEDNKEFFYETKYEEEEEKEEFTRLWDYIESSTNSSQNDLSELLKQYDPYLLGGKRQITIRVEDNGTLTPLALEQGFPFNLAAGPYTLQHTVNDEELGDLIKKCDEHGLKTFIESITRIDHLVHKIKVIDDLGNNIINNNHNHNNTEIVEQELKLAQTEPDKFYEKYSEQIKAISSQAFEEQFNALAENKAREIVIAQIIEPNTGRETETFIQNKQLIDAGEIVYGKLVRKYTSILSELIKEIFEEGDYEIKAHIAPHCLIKITPPPFEIAPDNYNFNPTINNERESEEDITAKYKQMSRVIALNRILCNNIPEEKRQLYMNFNEKGQAKNLTELGAAYYGDAINSLSSIIFKILHENTRAGGEFKFNLYVNMEPPENKESNNTEYNPANSSSTLN